MMEDEKNIKKDAKIIMNMGIARSLLRAGCQVIDCKADKYNKERTVLVFKADNHFWQEFERINNEIAASKKELENAAQE